MSIVHFKTQTEFDASCNAFMAQHGKRFPFISYIGQLPLFANGGADLCADVLKWLRKRRIKYAHHHGFVVFSKESDAKGMLELPQGCRICVRLSVRRSSRCAASRPPSARLNSSRTAFGIKRSGSKF